MDAQFQRHDGTTAKAVLEELVDVYAEVYNVPPYIGDPFFSVQSYRDSLLAAFDMPGFETVTASQDGQIIGYVHGVTLASDRAWWVSLGDDRPEELRRAAEDGQIFWLRELMVRPNRTNQGLGRQLHDTIIAGRAETITTLTCIIDNQPAHDAYLRWGYSMMG
ncbi:MULTISPECIES: GNAT family N-acetyltransferase [unclassified Streptomyces]|uniref:GNAT family N-acetyltransferase n=1 Tax=unclassified Streptomyces TaxID=2593676 RepID=UPI002E817D97|nr:GNAT family N-acetyltransferase [Streptomyces sp. NBC_00589]WTI42359.1 GNAT family N-acetyltransferase [Streptomyces sp. NBC_00775]WUB23959.1 GNAT family N-acetyltransferase [Streptomyces sp. NBC_00589]